jgi:NADH dehydrogenase FAD-containing subunit
MAATKDTVGPYDVVVLGAGYTGMMAALRLARSPLRVALLSAHEEFVERVRLQEGIAAEIAPRIPSIRAFLASTPIEFIRGTATSLDPVRKRVLLEANRGTLQIGFGQLVYALGSTIDWCDVPGAAEHAYRLDFGPGPRSTAALRAYLRKHCGRAVRIVIVGGAETGVEVAAEIKTTSPSAQVTLISRSRCGGSRGPRVERVVRATLGRLGVSIIDGEAVTAVRGHEALTASGRSIEYDICVWAGGFRSPPLALQAGIATDLRGRVWVARDLRSVSHPDILACGDAAHPIDSTGAPYRLSAFVALASGTYAADCIAAKREGRHLPPFSFSTFGQGIAIGHQGVGFLSFPDDRPGLFLVKGRAARRLRDAFVWFLIVILRLERRWPGLFSWPGRRRVSSGQAVNGQVEPCLKNRDYGACDYRK